SAVLQQISTLLRYAAAVEEACEYKTDKKRLCIKFKDLDHAFMRQLDPHTVCWKYLTCLLNNFYSTLEKEFEQPLKVYEYYGDCELSDLFVSKLPLLVRNCKSEKNCRTVHRFISICYHG